MHADIGYDLVNCSSLELNGISVDSTKADNRGDLVAKFNRTAIAGLVGGGDTLTLTLTGFPTGGEEFTGSDEIRVIDQPV